MVENSAIKELVDSIKTPESDTNQVYSAIVSRVDREGVVWVFVAGSDKETPTASTSAEVKSGDIVTVQWRNNKLYIGGNYSNPSAGWQTVRPSVSYIADLLNGNITVNMITASAAFIGVLEANNINAKDITADNAYIKTLTADDITAQTIIADHGTIANLDSNYAHITNGVIDNAKIGYADVNGLAANYARIDAANIDTAVIRESWIDSLMVQTRLIADRQNVFYLDALNVDAENITAGTLDVERLIISQADPQDPSVFHKYLLHIDPVTSQQSLVKMDGDVLGDRTITANKIKANSITANEITAQNIVGTGGWINLTNGTFKYVNASTGNGIDWSDGQHLSIITDSLLIGSVPAATTSDVNEAKKHATNYLSYTANDGVTIGYTGLSSKVNIKSDGIRLYDGVGNLGSYVSSSGLTVYTQISGSGVDVASFGSSARIGPNKSGYTRTLIDADGLKFIRKTNFGDQLLAQIGFASGSSSSGTDTAPFASFGERKASPAAGNYAFEAGYSCSATGYCAQSFGNWTEATGAYYHAEGITSTASGSSAHAEGGSTTASGASAHSEGTSTTASGSNSHTEGYNTTASGSQSHSEGRDTSAGGDYSHAQNWGTIASGTCQTAIGRYNIEHSGNTVGTPVFIIGNGSASHPSDALTVDWSGNVDIASGAKYKINGTNLSASDVSAVALSDKYTRSSTGTLDWSTQADGEAKIITKSALAWWDGRYNGTGSNLSYCSQGRIVGRNQICYANSRVDTFSSGVITLSLATLGITTEEKPVGILLTPEYGNGVIMKYDYDGSSASGVKIYAYNHDGTAYAGALRYFAVVFQSTWTST